MTVLLLGADVDINFAGHAVADNRRRADRAVIQEHDDRLLLREWTGNNVFKCHSSQARQLPRFTAVLTRSDVRPTASLLHHHIVDARRGFLSVQVKAFLRSLAVCEKSS